MKTAQLLRLELEHRNAGDAKFLLILAKLTDEQLVTHHRENRQRDLEIQQRKAAGFGFIEILITCAIVMVLAAALAVNLMKTIQVAEAKAAANTIQRVSYAELAFSNLWGPAFTAPSNLTPTSSTTATPGTIGCTNPQLLMGQDAQPQGVEGYTIAFAGAGAATGASTCATVPLVQSYVMTATPSIATGRYFYLSSADGVLRFQDGSPASISSPVYPLIATANATNSTVIVASTTAAPPQGCPSGETGTPPNCTSNSNFTPGPVINSISTFTLDPSVGSGQYWMALNFAGPYVGSNIAAIALIPKTFDTGTLPSSSPIGSENISAVSLQLTQPTTGNMVVLLIDLTALPANITPQNAGGGTTGVISFLIPPGQTSGGGLAPSGGYALNPAHSYTVRFTTQHLWTGTATMTLQFP